MHADFGLGYCNPCERFGVLPVEGLASGQGVGVALLARCQVVVPERFLL
jgi:hypothetical protein